MKRVFVIGGEKCGTTSLFSELSANDDCYLPTTKECNFFNPLTAAGRRNNLFRNKEYYQDLFPLETIKNKKYAVDISPMYSDSEIAIKNIHSCYPDALIICLIRDPFERSWSQYLMYKRNGLYKHSYDIQLTRSPELVSRSDFHTLKKNCQKYFSESQILFVDYFNDRESLYEFLELKMPVDVFIENISSSYRFPVLVRMVSSLVISLKKYSLFRYLYSNKYVKISRNYIYTNVKKTGNPKQLPPERYRVIFQTMLND